MDDHSSDAAVAVGSTATASGRASFAAGIDTTASDDGAVAMGYNTTASGGAAVALGVDTSASGEDAVAMGYNTSASGEDAVAMGTGTSASGETAVAMGYNTTASGEGAMTTGIRTTASGSVAVAMGYNTSASGEGAMTTGIRTTASGDLSTAMGAMTNARSYAEVVIGVGNEEPELPCAKGEMQAWCESDAIFRVGIGNSRKLFDDLLAAHGLEKATALFEAKEAAGELPIRKRDGLRVMKDGRIFIAGLEDDLVSVLREQSSRILELEIKLQEVKPRGEDWSGWYQWALLGAPLAAVCGWVWLKGEEL